MIRLHGANSDLFMGRLLLLGVLLCCSLAGVSQVKDLYETATGDDVSAYRHKDNFTGWIDVTDPTVRVGKANRVSYRILSCQTLVNKKTGKIAHPIGVIEVKAQGQVINGVVTIAGQGVRSGEMYRDTIRQFFHVDGTEPVFSVETAITFTKIDGIHVGIFDNDISDVYSKKDDEGAVGREGGGVVKKEEDNLSDEQVRKVFDLIFGAGASAGLEIEEQDRKQARLFMTELVRRSCQMAIVEGLKDFEPTLKALGKSIYKTLSNCKAASDGQYYEIIRKTIAFNFRSSFQLRKETGGW
jgi:hypothetical protein